MERLGVAHENVAAGPQFSAQAIEYLFLRGPFEIDDDVAAENEVHQFVGCQVLHQIVPCEPDHGPQPRHDAHPGPGCVFASEQEPAPQVHPDRGDVLLGVNGQTGLVDHPNRAAVVGKDSAQMNADFTKVVLAYERLWTLV